MKVLVIYDSFYGNTKKVAEAVGSSFNPAATVVSVEELHMDMVKNADLLVVGSPIFGW